jgi:hypothetical protein
VSGAQDQLQRALAAEHAAVYAYGVIGAHLTGDELELARAADRAHRDLRDTVADLVTSAGSTPAPAAAAYRLPKPVSDRRGALALAVEIETRVAAVWRSALGTLPRANRETALQALIDAAVRAAGWREAADPDASPVVPWPGR